MKSGTIKIVNPQFDVDRAWRVDRFTTSIVDNAWTITGPADIALSAESIVETGAADRANRAVGKVIVEKSSGPNHRTTSPHVELEKIIRNSLFAFAFDRLVQLYPHHAHDYPYHFYLRNFYLLEEENILAGLE